MATTSVGGYIAYETYGIRKIAVYASIANAQADAAAINAAVTAGETVVIGTDLVDLTTGTFTGQTALFVTPDSGETGTYLVTG